ncbi:flagellar biosynthetic protein FlhF [Gulbenkiania indica]|uniref:Flagellar biosynthesis protein FlhF n=1 Tax=Gulbenkiania indica TaxID=375574 RepID=A0A0K6H6P7_9NEIS|nr:flagellar biosynthesis protein FlhF [Gulbenkiania indica]CUA86422.1 flagellar biosynthetic protein FlhF [Gulbenkiania indica]
MVVKKYYGKTTRDALRQVREELGTDALILSNRPTVGGGVEIMAVADADVANLASSLSTSTSRHPPRNNPAAISRPGMPPAVQPSATTVQGGAPVNRALARTYALPVEPMEAAPASIPPLRATSPQPPAAAQPLSGPAGMAPTSRLAEASVSSPSQPAPVPPPAAVREPAPQVPPAANDEPEVMAHELKQIGDEIKLLRSLLQSQLASFAWSDMEHRTPNRIELFKQLLAMGLSAALIRQLIEKMPGQYEGEVALKWARSALMHNLKCVDGDTELLDRGGVFALVGPTGVGKTTTVAKLAARATLKFGAQHVALVTTDTYRIGAQDQLRIYGKILGVPVYSVQNEGDLQLTLADLSTRHIVFIDTVGMGQRDARVASQTEMFAAAGRPVERLLLVAANADGHTLEDVVRHYRGAGLAGCLLSKIDESVTLGPSIDVIIRNRLRLFYVTNGQRVPEDLHKASAGFLIDRALRAPQTNSPFSLLGDEMPIMHAAQAGWL